MPIAPPNHVALDLTRPPVLPEVATARADLVRRPGATAAAAFNVGETEAATASGAADKPVAPAAFKRFEAMVLQTFIQNMLPKDGAAVYGKGMAGDMWKSLLAEKVADVMADRGGIGIADRVLGERYGAGAAGIPTAPTAADQTTTKRG